MYDPFAPPTMQPVPVASPPTATTSSPPMMRPGAIQGSPATNALSALYTKYQNMIPGQPGNTPGMPTIPGLPHMNWAGNGYLGALADWRAGMPQRPQGGFDDPAARQAWMQSMHDYRQTRPRWNDWRAGSSDGSSGPIMQPLGGTAVKPTTIAPGEPYPMPPLAGGLRTGM